MIRKHLTIIGTIFTAALIGLVHIYTPVVSGHSSHTSSHSQHANDSSCKVACQATVDKRKNRPSEIKDQDDTPPSKPLYFNIVAIETIGVGLLQAGTLWRQSSWTPPDITLLSGHYSSSL